MLCPQCGIEVPADFRFCNGCGANLSDIPPDAQTGVIPPTSQETSIAPSDDFVGRHHEIGELISALDDAGSGQGRLVMLVGEPGIGKTRTAQELAAIAEERGAQTFWGRCYESEGAPPYWPWAQTIRAYVQQADAERLSKELASGAAAVAEIIPEIAEKLPDLAPAQRLEPEQARFRLFNSIATFLKSAAENQSLMMVLEDLHWADASSLLLLEFVAANLINSRLLIVGTYRDVEVSRGHPLARTLGNLVRETGSGGFQRVQLHGLTVEQVGDLVSISRSDELPQNLVATVHNRTEGNPFFVGEVVRLLVDEKPDEIHRWESSIPEGVRDMIGRRLDRLSSQCNQALITASVVGREFEFGLLAELMRDIPEDDLLLALDEALDAHVIEEAPGGPERYQFIHALVQQTLSEELSTSRRVRLHARIGEALEQINADNVTAHVSELAYHFSEAQTLLGTDKLAHYTLAAGEQALAAYAFEEAIELYQRALDAMAEHPADEHKADLLFGLGRGQAAVLGRSELQQAADSLIAAFDSYLQSGDDENALKVALNIFPNMHGVSGLADMLFRGNELAPSDSVEAAHILAEYGQFISFETGDYEKASAAFSRAKEIAQINDDIGLEIHVLINASIIEWIHLYFTESLEDSQRARLLAQQIGDIPLEARSTQPASIVLTALGRTREAKEWVAADLSLAQRMRTTASLGMAYSVNTALSASLGEWNDAREFSDEGMIIAPSDWRLIHARMCVEYQTGNFETAARYFSMLRKVGMTTTAAGYAAWVTGNADEFTEFEKDSRQGISIAGQEPEQRLRDRIFLAVMAVLKKDTHALAEQYFHMSEHRGFVVPNQNMSIDRILGVLAHAMGNFAQATEHFEDALTFCRNAGYRPELAWTCHDYANMLIQRTGPGDLPMAVEFVDEAHQIASSLEMKPLIQRVIALKEQLDARPAPRPQYPDGLTEREVEVLRLVAAGMTNREIGEELFIALNTVARHVNHIFNKTAS
ncbi:MAG: AAA family ATPase, partial [SAR202 cluster bacterium]|nr:AAA family ATPase [SAR202 cluster bacterium]